MFSENFLNTFSILVISKFPEILFVNFDKFALNFQKTYLTLLIINLVNIFKEITKFSSKIF